MPASCRLPDCARRRVSRPSRRRRAAGGSPSPVPHHSTRRRSSSRSPPGWWRACSPASAYPRLAPSIPCSTLRVSPCRSRIGRTRCPLRSRGPASWRRRIRAARCAPAPTRGGSTRTGRRGGMPWCARSSDRWTAIRRRSRTPSSLPSWVSRGIRSGPAHSTGRGGCRVTPTGTPTGWQRSASGSPGSRRWHARPVRG